MQLRWGFPVKQVLLAQTLRLVMMAEGNHAFPSRTRPLSPPASMVLEPHRRSFWESRTLQSIKHNERAVLMKIKTALLICEEIPLGNFIEGFFYNVIET
jgi:hypothetical protein